MFALDKKQDLRKDLVLNNFILNSNDSKPHITFLKQEKPKKFDIKLELELI